MPSEPESPRRVLARVLAEDLNNEHIGGAALMKSLACNKNPDLCDEIVNDSWKLQDDQV